MAVSSFMMDKAVRYDCCHQKFDSSGVNNLQKFEFYSPVSQTRVKMFFLTFFLKKAIKGPEKSKKKDSDI